VLPEETVYGQAASKEKPPIEQSESGPGWTSIGRELLLREWIQGHMSVKVMRLHKFREPHTQHLSLSLSLSAFMGSVNLIF